MALLQELLTGRLFAASARSLIGRSRACGLVIQDRRISAEHATLFRDLNGRWMLRDLGSRNGTWVQGQRLSGGVAVALSSGEEIAFGNRESRWTLIDDGAPGPYARDADGALTLPVEGILLLPSEALPDLCVLAVDGEWQIDRGDAGAEQGADGQRLETVSGPRWLLLPRDPEDYHVSTTINRVEPPALGVVELLVEHSLDEEFIQFSWLHMGRRTELQPRAFHELILVLARARLADADSELPEVERGWLYVEEVCQELHAAPRKLNVDILRCRRQLAESGLAGAHGLFERRKTTRQIRLGTGRILIKRLGR